jgi:phage shock protein PspC (stress-responsive transcriptional regulator)
MNDSDPLLHQQRRARRPIGAKTLQRSSAAIIAGVAGGFARFTGANPRSVRLLFILALVLTFGFFGFVYVALWLLLPKA